MKAILLVVLFTLSTSVSAQCVVKLRVFQSPPNYYQVDNGLWKGVAVEKSIAIIEKAGCKIIYVEAPFKRALQFMSIGKVDMMSNLSRTSERERYIDYFALQRDETVGLVVPIKSRFSITSLDDFISLTKPIGFLHGAFYGEEFEAMVRNNPKFSNKFSSFYDVEAMFKALKHKRISGFVYDQKSANKILSVDGNNQYFKLHSFVVYKNSIYFGLSKQSVSNEVKEKLREAYQSLSAQ